MTIIVPITDMRNTSKMYELSETQPVFITKNGYGDMVIMSMSYYEDMLGRNAIYAKLG